MLTKKQISIIYDCPLLELITQARGVHKQNFADDIELCQLISVKTGGCTEDCAYCSQSVHNNAEIRVNSLLPLEVVKKVAGIAKEQGIKRICMGAAYSGPNDSDLTKVIEYIKLIKQYGLEACVTLGSLSEEQAMQLKAAGLDYYNHNIDTSPEYYPQIVTTRTFNDRITTIGNVGKAGIKICCGGILGMGESKEDRVSFIHALTELPYCPNSIPINTLVKIPGTKLADAPPLDKLELVKVIATVRIIFPQTRIRLSAGRSELSELEQTMCFMAGANSIFYGEQLLTAPNNEQGADQQLLNKLGIVNA